MTEQTTDLEFDRGVLGVEVELGQFEVRREHILAFCAAVGETNPLYTDEVAAAQGPHGVLVAPPVFYGAARVGAGLDPKVNFGNVTFAAGQRAEFGTPIRVGDTITITTSIHEVYEKTGRSGRMVFVVRRTTYRNQHGETCATVDSSQVHRQVER